MQINWKIVSGVLATVVIVDETIGVINKRKFARVKTQRDTYEEMMQYLASVMDKRETPFTNFDRIAVNTIMEKLKTQ